MKKATLSSKAAGHAFRLLASACLALLFACSQTKPDDVVQVRVLQGGEILLQGTALREGELEPRLKELLAARPSLELRLSIDKGVVYQEVGKVMATAQQAGIVKIKVQQ